ncbi:acyl-CoA dehydrogenase family protein [Bacillus salipaludis]|uniref:acyl-CoA dehydrogenase family protein n=1 Tax=Bacillus salipaludis TaxID=2547811 RepID=UPI002E225462|nr:acyl-CoA dehydrogenase family protein [Bacillus salipaludis]
MVNQKQEANHQEPPTFTLSKPIKAGSHELDVLLAKIAENAEKRRSSGNGSHPFYAIDLIKQSRLGALRIPVEMGGGGASLRDLFKVVILLAEKDSDVAHILRTHYGFVDEALLTPNTELNQMIITRAAQGEIFGNASTEISSRNVGDANYVFETTVSPDGEGYRLNGTKSFCTGTYYADWVGVRASNLEGTTVTVFVPTNREGVELEDDWDGIGQRWTGSGTTRFKNVFVYPYELVENGAEFTSNYFLQLYLQAIMAGILRNVVSDASKLVLQRSRTFSHGAASSALEDPQIQQIIGQLSSNAFAAEAIVLSAADAQDMVFNSATDGVKNNDLIHNASLQAAQTKVIIEDFAFKAATQLFDVGGASAATKSKNLDRHWRNLRTLASHNPAMYKARAIGNYVVNGTRLPLNRYF